MSAFLWWFAFFVLFLHLNADLASAFSNVKYEAENGDSELKHTTRPLLQLEQGLEALDSRVGSREVFTEASSGTKRRKLIDNQLSIKRWLDAHNEVRMKYFQGNELVWDPNLARYAEAHGDAISRIPNCAPEFNEENVDYGENLYWSVYEHGQDPWTISECVKEWADQSKNYDYIQNKCAEGEDCSAFLQLVWKNTTQIGCAEVYCPYKGDFLGVAQFFICNYFPPASIEDNHPKPY